MSAVLSAEQKRALIARWQAVKNHIATLESQQPVTLVAVSKTHPAEMIAVLAEQGQRDFGENYLQEALAKIKQLQGVTAEGNPLMWHYIGHIQRNKTRDIAQHFDWVHGVDRLIIAERLNEQRPTTLAPLNICIQVNIDDEASKSGCQPAELPELVQKISSLPNLVLRGLMVIPAPVAKQASPNAFEQTKNLFENCRSYHAKPDVWDTLSMGMSGDIEAAIQAGATIVRVGTAIFGERDYTN